MQVSRDISDPKVASFLQNASEEMLRMAMEEMAADEEIAAAIAYSHEHDQPEDRMDGEEFLTSIGRRGEK
ncbi:MAG: hypothetical protein HQL84_05790 [Magnetococcales bacterium]|nr:hypothetical protein [Magnetococcales bacterium]MBF0149544.1 hypothetical protein [Magnetococcales bacterium]MBF0631931.1 hypothetical protein [Magnetococcales bacterium]